MFLSVFWVFRKDVLWNHESSFFVAKLLNTSVTNTLCNLYYTSYYLSFDQVYIVYISNKLSFKDVDQLSKKKFLYYFIHLRFEWLYSSIKYLA